MEVWKLLVVPNFWDNPQILRFLRLQICLAPALRLLPGPGAGIMGIKSQHVTQRRERAIQAEKAKKLGLQLA